MSDQKDPLIAIFDSFLARNGEGRGDVEFLARDVFRFPGECESIAELQERMAAQMAGLVQGLADIGILDNAEHTNSVLLSVMRATQLR